MEIKQQLSLKQKIVASQSMIQYLGLIQMDQLELAEHINKILSENPVLDRAEDWEALNRIAELKQRFLWMNNYAGRSQAADLSAIHDINGQESASAGYLETLEFSLKEQLEQTDIDPT